MTTRPPTLFLSGSAAAVDGTAEPNTAPALIGISGSRPKSGTTTDGGDGRRRTTDDDGRRTPPSLSLSLLSAVCLSGQKSAAAKVSTATDAAT